MKFIGLSVIFFSAINTLAETKTLQEQLLGTWEIGCGPYGKGSVNQQTTFRNENSGETITVFYSDRGCKTETSRLQQPFHYQMSSSLKPDTLIVFYQHDQQGVHNVAKDKLSVKFTKDYTVTEVTLVASKVYREGKVVSLSKAELAGNGTIVQNRVVDANSIIQHQ